MSINVTAGECGHIVLAVEGMEFPGYTSNEWTKASVSESMTVTEARALAAALIQLAAVAEGEVKP